MRYKLLFLLLLSTIICFGKPARVIRVIDGDTFVIETGERVRVLGINAPEMKTEYGEPAKEHLLSLIDGKTVDLQPDHISKDKDVYGRLLRYVILDGVDIDKKMVTDGYAIAFLKYPFDKEKEYKEEELKARSASLGIWKNNDNSETAANDNAANSQPSRFNIFLVIALAIIIILVAVMLLKRRNR